MCLLVALVSAAAAAAGYVLLDPAAGLMGPGAQAFDQAFAAGTLLNMRTDTMLSEAFQEERDFTGAMVVLGFAASISLAAL
jgi:hypothetical protein